LKVAVEHEQRAMTTALPRIAPRPRKPPRFLSHIFN